jgi:hypothetical protein
MIYIGIVSSKSQQDGSGTFKAIYPEGQIAIVNDNGTYGAYVAGRTEGIRIEGYQVFENAQDALSWVMQK